MPAKSSGAPFGNVSASSELGAERPIRPRASVRAERLGDVAPPHTADDVASPISRFQNMECLALCFPGRRRPRRRRLRRGCTTGFFLTDLSASTTCCRTGRSPRQARAGRPGTLVSAALRPLARPLAGIRAFIRDVPSPPGRLGAPWARRRSGRGRERPPLAPALFAQPAPNRGVAPSHARFVPLEENRLVGTCLRRLVGAGRRRVDQAGCIAKTGSQPAGLPSRAARQRYTYGCAHHRRHCH